MTKTACKEHLDTPETEPKSAMSILFVKYVNNEPHFLISQRKKDPEKDRYNVVTGKIENQETPHGCAIRETHEETSMTINVNDLHTISYGTQEFRRLRKIYNHPADYLVIWNECMGEPMLPKEEVEKQTEWKWISMTMACELSDHDMLSLSASILLAIFDECDLDNLIRSGRLGEFIPIPHVESVNRLLPSLLDEYTTEMIALM